MAAEETRPRQAEHRGLRILIAAAITLITWGSAFTGIQVGLVTFSPGHLALLRYAVASLVLVIYALLTRLPLPQRRDLPGLTLIGLVGIAFYNIALGYGEITIPAGTASLLIASTPIWMALLALAIFGERPRPWGWIGIAVSFVGVAVIALGTGKGLRIDPRALLVLAAALASCLYSLGQKPYLTRYSALQCTAYAIWAGTLCLLPFGGGLLAEMRAASPGTLATVIYLGVFPGALGYIAWAYVLARTPAATAGSLLYLVPAVAMLVAWLWRHEVPRPLSLAGGVLVLAGVILVNRWGRAQLAPRQAEHGGQDQRATRHPGGRDCLAEQ